jgi:hypothetical protein
MMMDEHHFFGWQNQQPITFKRTADKQKQLIIYLPFFPLMTHFE